MPSGEAYTKLKNLISQLSEKYSTPVFEPHVTLIGSVLGPEDEILSKTSKLASVIEPYRIKLRKIGYLDEYTKWLFIKAEKTDEVMNANLKARDIFNRQDDSEYMPHLSLMYSNLPLKIREEIITEIGEESNITFDVGAIHLFSTTGEPKEWYRVKEFALK